MSYIVNQRSGLEADPNSGLAGDHVVIQTRCFTNLSQRWALAALSAGKRKVSNLSSGLCLDCTSGNPIVQATANSSQEQEWDVVSAVNGYFHLINRLSGWVLDLNSSGTAIQQSANSSSQAQQWQIVPVH